MVSTISRWFGGRSRADRPTAHELKAEKDRSSISYSPQLVPALLQDHKNLFAVFGQIATAVEAAHYDQIPKLLGDFKTRLDVHLLNENLRFYCYLEERLANSPHELDIIKGFRREMNDIARGAVQFIRKWRHSGVSADTRGEFLREYGDVGQLLQQRIDREESGLYPLYTP